MKPQAPPRDPRDLGTLPEAPVELRSLVGRGAPLASDPGMATIIGAPPPTVSLPLDEERYAMQRRLGQDYERAMQRAFDDAARRVEAVLRPMGRVLAVDGEQMGLVGGSIHGLQSGDELVIFRATVAKVGETQVFATMRPVAVVRCDGVGTETSQCTLVRRDPALNPQQGDYAVLTDFSATILRVSSSRLLRPSESSLASTCSSAPSAECVSSCRWVRRLDTSRRSPRMTFSMRAISPQA
mgnify:CR=1 FL=1